MTINQLCGAVLACLLLAGVAAAQAQTDSTGKPDVVVAIVNGKELRRSDVIESAAGLPAPYQQQIEQIFPALIERLIDLNLLTAEGRRQGLQNDSGVKAQIARFEDEVVRETLLDRYLEKQVTDAAVDARYRQIVADFPKQVEVRARHILVEQEAEAQAVVAELEGGADFATVAKEKSVDSASAAKGGDLGFFVAEQMVPEFAEAAFALQPGEFTRKPVKTQFGWHIIKADERRDKTPPTLDEAREQIRSELSQEIVGALLSDLRGKSTIQRFNPDGTPLTESPAPAPAPAQ